MKHTMTAIHLAKDKQIIHQQRNGLYVLRWTTQIDDGRGPAQEHNGQMKTSFNFSKKKMSQRIISSTQSKQLAILKWRKYVFN